MRFTIVFKRFVDNVNVEKFSKENLRVVYEDEDILIFSNMQIHSNSGALLLGYKTFGGGPPSHSTLPRNVFDLDETLDGKYLVLDLDNGLLFTDPVGIQHVYVSDGVISSELKLIRLVKRDFSSILLSPNKVYKLVDYGRSMVLQYVKPLLNVNDFNFDGYYTSLSELSDIYLRLVKRKISAISRYVNGGVNKVYISFSGGVDSSLVAKLSSELIGSIYLVTVCVKGSFDDHNSKASAKLLGLEDRHILYYVGSSDLRGELDDVVFIIEDWRLMQVSLGIPLNILLKHFAGGGVVLMGQGSDEMFGGYKKYLDSYQKVGEGAANFEMAMDVYLSYRNNFSREQKLADYYGSYLFYPLISPSTMLLALNAPLQYKIRDASDDMRKWVVREAANKINLPRDIVLRKKKALQYSSRIQKLLIKELGRNYREILYNIYLKYFS